MDAFIIEDWAGNRILPSEIFESFEDGISRVHELADRDVADMGVAMADEDAYEAAYEECLGEYYVVKKD